MDDNLVNQWKIWYHSINDTNWNNESYKLIYTIQNVFDISVLDELMKGNHLQNAMFFIMKDDIFPTWEDPDNREGSFISYKIPAPVLKENWMLIIKKIIFQDFLINKDKNLEINGFSISPKKEFNIIKIWLKDYDPEFVNCLNEYPPYIVKDKMIHRKHIT